MIEINKKIEVNRVIEINIIIQIIKKLTYDRK